MVMPQLLFETFSRITKRKSQGALERNMDMWKIGKLETCWSFSEKVKQFNKAYKSTNNQKSMTEISKKFNGAINGARKLLTNNFTP